MYSHTINTNNVKVCSTIFTFMIAVIATTTSFSFVLDYYIQLQNKVLIKTFFKIDLLNEL